MDMPTILTYY